MSGVDNRGAVLLNNEANLLAEKIARHFLAGLADTIGAAIVGGKINADAVSGVLPIRSGGTGTDTGIRDHNHDGTATQELEAVHTHVGVVLGPSTGAIHWTQAALVALIAASPGRETFGIVFTGAGDVALRGDGSIATKRY